MLYAIYRTIQQTNITETNKRQKLRQKKKKKMFHHSSRKKVENKKLKLQGGKNTLKEIRRISMNASLCDPSNPVQEACFNNDRKKSSLDYANCQERERI